MIVSNVRFHLMRTAAFLVLVGALILINLAVALADISVGQAFGAWKEYIDAIVSAVVFALVGLLFAAVYKWTGIKIEDSQRQALQTALTNGAALVLNKLENKLQGKTVTTGSPGVDDAVNYVLKSAPAAVAKFGLTPAELREKIIAKVPQVANTTTPTT